MKNRYGLIAGSILSAALTLAACAQHARMAESGMMEGEKMKMEAEMMEKDGNRKTDAGMMEKGGNMKKEQMKESNKNTM